MFGIRVTINDGVSVVAAAEDAIQVIAMLTATGVLGSATRPRWTGESQECWLSLRGLRRGAGSVDHVSWIRRYSLGVGDQLVIEVVDTDDTSLPLPDSAEHRPHVGSPTYMYGFVVTFNDEPPITGAADDLYVLTAVVGASGALGRLATPAQRDQAQSYRLSLDGLTSSRLGQGDEHLHWLHRDDLTVGDRVKIDIVETTQASVPAERSPRA